MPIALKVALQRQIMWKNEVGYLLLILYGVISGYTLRVWWFITFIVVSTLTYGQEPNFRHYGENEGLVGLKVYKVLNDRDGFLWFATGYGVTRYNGVDFKNYNSNNGYPYTGAFYMDNDSRGRLWFGTFEDKVCFYENGLFWKFNTPYNISWFCFGEKDNAYFFTVNGHILHYIADTLVRDIRVGADRIQQGFVLRDGTLVAYSTEIGIIEVDKRGQITVIVPVERCVRKFNKTRLFRLKSGRVLLLLDNSLYEIANRKLNLISVFDGSKFDANSDVIDILEDNANDVWLCRVDGLHRVSLSSGRSDCYFRGGPVSGIVQDREGNFWFSTLAQGVYMFRYKTTENTLIENEKHNFIASISGYGSDSVFLFYTDGTIKKLRYRNGQYSLEIVLKVTEGTFINVKKSGNGAFVIRTSHGHFRFDGSRITPDSVYQLRYLGWDNKLYNIAEGSDLTYFDGEKWVLQEGYGRVPVALHDYGRLYHYAVKDGKIWGGNHNGLFVVSDSVMYRPFKDSGTFSYVNDIVADKDGVLWVANTSNGAYYVKDNAIHKLRREDGFFSKECTTLFLDENSDVWMGCTDGMYKIQKQAGKFRIFNLSNVGLLPSPRVQSVYKCANKVYAVTRAGVVIFDEDHAINDSIISPLIHITGVSANNIPVPIKRSLEFSYKQKNLNIEYAAISFAWGREPKYYYCLVGKDSMWIGTAETSVNFVSLAPGKYSFYVLAENVDGKRSLPAKIEFVIKPPFWQTWWFFTLCCFALATIAILIAKHYRNIAKKEKLYYESELKALRAQMNPHFIFNALNAIQEFTLNNDKPKANYYLVQFSKLMRGILENSKNTLISLNQEIEFLKLYLEIESFRFDNKFTYSITLSKDVDADSTNIPSMILQPFVENAINHGLAPTRNGGHLKIEITREHGAIKCIIEDNGVGRSGKQNSTHTSSGILITESRLKLLNQPGTKSMTITDLVDEYGNSAGTRVELWINHVVSQSKRV